MAIEKSMRQVCDEIVTVVIKKNHDYGDNNLLRHGLRGILIRLDDKSARLANLLDKAGQVDDETVEDTLKDIAGYAMQGIRLIREGTIVLYKQDQMTLNGIDKKEKDQ